MDNESPLYLAHQKGRSAEKLMKTRQYDAAVICHEKASDLIQQAMTLTRYAKALESLELQFLYHRKQTDIIKAKKLQHEIQQKVAELRKKKKMEKKAFSPAEQKDQELQWAILKTMEEADSLLGMLRERSERRAKDEDAPEDKSPTEGFKLPKDEKTVIEELRTVNAQLREFVSKLLSQLDASRREIDSLRARIKIYEDSGLPDLAPLELPNFDYSSL